MTCARPPPGQGWPPVPAPHLTAGVQSSPPADGRPQRPTGANQIRVLLAVPLAPGVTFAPAPTRLDPDRRPVPVILDEVHSLRPWEDPQARRTLARHLRALLIPEDDA